MKFELLYNSTRDGFDHVKLHELIDNKGPNLTILKTNHNKVIGAYTSLH
jgi:hypothetical protein